MKTLADFQNTKEFLVCVDSDGCAMDTMDIKHFRCFGPCMAVEWGLEQWKQPILDRWNEVNLYTMTRGINRFKGLSHALLEVNEKYMSIDGVKALSDWVETSPELSNEALQRQIELVPDCQIFKKALAWSIEVNKNIKALPEEEIKPYEGVREALAFAHERADVAIVSSANLGAVLEEWEKHELLPHTDIVLAQNAGSKAFCIAELLKKGYSLDKVLMCGDAPGDMQAAEKNGVFYYPILVRNEAQSWSEFMAEGLERMINGTYAGEYQRKKRNEFLNNLGGNDNA